MKNILLAVTGLSPQVITETLFALHQQNRTVDAIHIITTRQGKEKINAYLLAPTDGKYYQYLKEYEIDPATIDFGFQNIHTIKDENGIEIDDIEGEEENERLLKKCLELAFPFTKDSNKTVFFSIAGGRKTMSSCLMLAAQLYGRPQDRVYHVLVSPEFESNRDFFYPPKKSVPIELKDKNGQPYVKETKYARINLVPIPFVSIRDKLSENMLDEPKDPATLMLSLVREEPYQLTIDFPGCKLAYKNIELDMMPAKLALYAFFALQKKNCKEDLASCRGCTECFLEAQEIFDRQEEITDLYRKIAGTRELCEMSDSGILGLTPENFNSYKAKIRKDLERGFGLLALAELAIESVGKRPDTRYGIKMDKGKIRVIF
ncbi:MAG: TIGR02584 family CRISPR-associated protein [Deltaproteobacteria bacterium]|nr:TIGR02584 family CRISPR-associated protein [Deltaproteobacteria bacterium]RLE62796.1 MAG: TIGR02584 family CRISPR-associated protein [Thermoprotei archaeon]